MRIAIFSDTYIPQINGVVQTIVHITRELHASGHEVCLFVPRAGQVSGSQEHVFTYPGLRFLLYPELEIAVPGQLSVSRRLNKFKPDIIHVMTPFSMGLSGLRYGIHHGIPVIGSYLTDFPQLTTHYRIEIVKGPLSRYLRWFYSQCRLTLCPSREILEKCRTRGIARLQLWKAGVDLSQFSPDHWDENTRARFAKKDEIIILYVGRLAGEKELGILISAATILEQRGVKHRLLVVGDGPSRSYLEGRAGKNVIFTGYKTERELQQLYASADIFAFPSPNETFGIAALEAMASGLPVVGANSGGLAQLVVNGENGLLYEKANVNELAEHLQLLASNSSLRQKLGIGAREYAQQFTWQQSCTELLAAYYQVLPRVKVT